MVISALPLPVVDRVLVRPVSRLQVDHAWKRRPDAFCLSGLTVAILPDAPIALDAPIMSGLYC